MMKPGEVVARGFCYPAPGRLEELRQAVDKDLSGATQRRMRRFVSAVEGLSLAQWEELHTRTLDLSPVLVPYVGHLTWGENYRRGEFMADLKRDMELHNVDLGGELPDHIEPVLRYLAVAPEPFPDLVNILADAVGQMRAAVKKAEPKNPYRHLLAAVESIVDRETPVAIGGSQ
ncbi:MAG: nitrate reductase [Acidimicrobiia bacterium]|nr:nitrate reductase [Acidimicrobiia bacterium]